MPSLRRLAALVLGLLLVQLNLEWGGHYGVAPVEMARASLTSQAVHLLSPLVPSTYLLGGLVGIDIGQHQRFTLAWAALLSLILLGAAMLLGVVPLAG